MSCPAANRVLGVGQFWRAQTDQFWSAPKRFVAGRAGIAVNQPITSFQPERTGLWPESPPRPSWAPLPEEGGGASNEMPIYASVAIVAIAAVWVMVD